MVILFGEKRAKMVSASGAKAERDRSARWRLLLAACLLPACCQTCWRGLCAGPAQALHGGQADRVCRLSEQSIHAKHAGRASTWAEPAVARVLSVQAERAARPAGHGQGTGEQDRARKPSRACRASLG